MARPPKPQDVHEGRGPTGETQGTHVLIIVNEDGNVVSFTPSAILSQFLHPAPACLPCSMDLLQASVREMVTNVQTTGAPVFGRRIQWRLDSGSTMEGEAHILPCVANRDSGNPQRTPVAVSVSPIGTPLTSTTALPETALLPWFASVAHEVKNSLVPLKTFVDLLLEREPQHEMADLLRREVQKISRAVGQMLWTAAPSQSRFGWVNVEEIVGAVLQRIRPQTQQRSIRLLTNLEAGDACLWGDSNQIEEALLNLVINGLEAVAEGGELTVSARVRASAPPRQGPRSGNIAAAASSGRWLVLSVHDNGSGISVEHFPRLFEQHFTTKPQGTGLGLSIAQQIMKSHGGGIEVASQLNQGTTFDLVFPFLERVPEVRA